MFDRIYSLKIFEGVEKETVSKIIKECELREYNSGEIIILEEEDSNWEWYIIKTWEVELIIWWEVIKELKSGDIFWEIALLNEEKRTATIKAKTDIVVFVLKIEHLIEMINNWNNTINKTILSRIEENIKIEN